MSEILVGKAIPCALPFHAWRVYYPTRDSRGVASTCTRAGAELSLPDVVLVGGGLIGLLTAVELREQGAQVTLVEKDDLGFEQSGRSVAAVNLPGGSSRGDPRSMLRVSADEWSTFGDRWDCDIHLNSEGWHIVIADDADSAW